VRYTDFVSIEEFQGMRQLGKSSRKKEMNLRGVKVKGKGKAIPLRVLTCPERSRRLRLPDFKTIST
jgi:hypothetical protein